MVGIVGLEPTCIQLLFQVGRNHRRYMPMNICFNCQKETINSKFCSRSCANSYNNKLKPKRHLTDTTAVYLFQHSRKF